MCCGLDALDIAAPGTHHGTPKGPGLSAKDPPAAYFDWSDHGAFKSRFVKLFLEILFKNTLHLANGVT